MNREQKINHIREKCIEANPSIRDLFEGCRISKEHIFKDGKHVAFGTIIRNMTYGNESPVVDISWDRGEMERMPTTFLEIIGRDIRLADVISVIHMIPTSTTDPAWFVDSQGFFTKIFGRPDLSNHSSEIIAQVELPKYQWNLLKDRLEDQSEECINFIYQLLA